MLRILNARWEHASKRLAGGMHVGRHPPRLCTLLRLRLTTGSVPAALSAVSPAAASGVPALCSVLLEGAPL